MCSALLLLLLLSSCVCWTAVTSTEVSSHQQQAATITVSGISGGAFMAVQFHIAHSSIVSGAGIVAGGPYYCAFGNLLTAQLNCMKTPALIDIDALVQVTKNTALTGTIDPLEHLADDRQLVSPLCS
jgi:poly(3-hydroxybutyrate) depolymerase